MRSSVASMTAAMPVKDSRPARNACTATSLAALSTQGAVPPATAASRASRRQAEGGASGHGGRAREPQAGEGAVVGRLEVQHADLRQVERRDGDVDAFRVVQ